MADKPICTYCTEIAVYVDRISGTHSCANHLMKSVEHRVFQEIQPYLCNDSSNASSACRAASMTIGVAFSGGKDSTALLAALSSLQGKCDISLIALTIDEGIFGYREDTINHAKMVCKKLDVPHVIISFSELFGASLDELMARFNQDSTVTTSPGQSNNQPCDTARACTICGILRRRALEILAEREQISVLVTGHNQNDAAQTFLMNLFSGDLKKMAAGSPGTIGSSRFSHRVKPFSTVSEREVVLYGVLRGYFAELVECPYAHQALRGEVRNILSELEYKNPGTIAHIAECERTVRNELVKRRSSLHTKALIPCKICGWPGSHNICQVCATLSRFNQ